MHDSSLTPMVTLQKSDLGRGPRFSVADPGVRYRGPLRSPILTVQAYVKSKSHCGFQKQTKLLIEVAQVSQSVKIAAIYLRFLK